MPLILTGVGVYSTTYLDANGNERRVTVRHGQDVEALNLPNEVLERFKKLTRQAGHKTIPYFTEEGGSKVVKLPEPELPQPAKIGNVVSAAEVRGLKIEPMQKEEQPEAKPVEAKPKEEKPKAEELKVEEPKAEEPKAEAPVKPKPKKAPAKKTGGKKGSTKKKTSAKKPAEEKVVEEAPKADDATE